MFKIDKVKNLFNCKLCNKLLSKPILLTCGNIICQGHIDEMVIDKTKENNTFKCHVCHNDHLLPKEGFIINEQIENLLNLQINTLTAGPEYDECKKVIEEARASFDKIESMENNSESYIYHYFEDIKRQVDLRREDLKLKIDTRSDEIIKSIKTTQLNYIKESKKVNQITRNIEQSKKELDQLITQFDTFEINDKKFENIKKSVASVNNKFKEIIEGYKSSLVGNEKHFFQFDEISVDDIFGHFVNDSEEVKFDSTILGTCDLSNQLIKLCQFPLEQKWKLQYRATRDGFSPVDFHSKCNGSANTLTIIKTTSGNVFGGFAEKAWNKSVFWVTDPSAFIFSLINKDNRPFKAMHSNNGECATTSFYMFNFRQSLAFGKRHDIFISSYSNASHSSYSGFGKSYRHPDYVYGSEEAKTILAGSNYFQTVEIEVFAKTD